MAGMRTVVLDALPGLGGEAVPLPLGAVAVVLVVSLLVGVFLSRAVLRDAPGSGASG
jgi:uncharacterized membrane protein YqiK